MLATDTTRNTASLAVHHEGRLPTALLELVHDAAMVLQPDLAIAYWNRGAERLFGVPQAQALGCRIDALLGAGAVPDPHCLAQLAADAGWEGELQWQLPHGKVVCVARRCALVGGSDAGPPSVLIVDSDLTERRRAEKEIVLLNNILEQRIRSRTAELEESNEDLRGFAHSLAHDLRGPLSSIDGFSAQLQQRLDGQLDDRCRHYLDRLRAGVQHMASLTDALLALAELSATRLQPQPVDLSALAAATLGRLSQAHAAHRPRVDVAPTQPVRGDPQLLAVVVDQLIGNAWKFTTGRTDARIAFGGAARPDGSYVFEVADNGVGFDPRYARRLFGPFQRLHAPTEYEGHGIGLAMVRKIVVRHGGRVWADSLPGQGATFRFTLAAPSGARPVPAA